MLSHRILSRFFQPSVESTPNLSPPESPRQACSRKRARSPSPPQSSPDCSTSLSSQLLEKKRQLELQNAPNIVVVTEEEPLPPPSLPLPIDRFVPLQTDCRDFRSYYCTLIKERIAEAELDKLPAPKPVESLIDPAPSLRAAQANLRHLLEPLQPPQPPSSAPVISPISATAASVMREVHADPEHAWEGVSTSQSDYHRSIGYRREEEVPEEEEEEAPVPSVRQALQQVDARALLRHKLELAQIEALENSEAALETAVIDFFDAEQQSALAARNEADGTRRRKLPPLHHFQQRRQVHTLIDYNNPTRPIAEVERMQLLVPASSLKNGAERTALADGASRATVLDMQTRRAPLELFVSDIDVDNVADLVSLGIVEEDIGSSFLSANRVERPPHCMHKECAGKNAPVKGRGLCGKHIKQLQRLSKKAMKS
jgi:hypothetical protein